MKSTQKIILCTLTAMALLAFTVFAQAHGAKMGESTATIGGGKVTVKYGRPQVGATVTDVKEFMKSFGAGKRWRMGKDVVTTLTSDVDLNFGGKTVPKGTYVLVAEKVDQDKWKLVLLSKGSAQQFDPANVVAEAPLVLTDAGKSVELMNIDVASQGDRGTVVLTWGTVKATTNFKKA